MNVFRRAWRRALREGHQRGVRPADWAFAVTRWHVWPYRVRAALLGVLCDSVAPDARVYVGVRIAGRHLSIGSEAFINTDCIIEASAPLSLGHGVHLGRGVQLTTASHAIGASERRAGAVTEGPITIGDGSWIGAGSIVLPGVTIGRGCVVAAGSVVVSDCEDNGLYAGVPAELKRVLDA